MNYAQHRPLATFGKRLKFARVERDLTQEQLRDEMHKQCGVTIGATYISELERSSKSPSLPIAAAMAKVLGVSLDYLGLLTDEDLPVVGQPETELA